jgi:hypothetical protein
MRARWLVLLVLFAAPATAQTGDAARAAHDAALPALTRAAPDEVLDRLRQWLTAIVAPLPSFQPGSRAIDLALDQAWPSLRRRCPNSTPLAAPDALALADAILREAGAAGRATPAQRGQLAAGIAALDGRLCACAARPSLALAADCAS